MLTLMMLAKLTPNDAKNRILTAFEQGHGRLERAACHLETHPDSVERIITLLGIRDDVRAIKARFRPPPKSTAAVR